MEKFLTTEEIRLHIKNMSGKNCVYTVIQNKINKIKKEKKDAYFKALEEKKFKSYTELDIFLENS